MEYRSVMVTGVYGFIGAHLMKYLVKKYPKTRFIGVDKISYCSNVKNIKEINSSDNFIMKENDINDLIKMQEIVNDYNIDCIIHLAAYSAVDLSFETPLNFTLNNVLGTHALLELTKNNKSIKRFIYMSTDEVYGPTKEYVNEEYTQYNPTNPYSATKAAAEMLCKAYITSYNLPIIITRANNIYGENQFHEKVIPKFVKQIMNCEAITIHGNGSVLRNFLHVKDFCDAYDYILTKGKLHEIYNIGGEYEISIKDLAEKMIYLMKTDKEIQRIISFTQKEYLNNSIEKIIYIKDRPFNDNFYHINCDKIHKLGWNEKIQFDSEEGFVSIIRHYVESNIKNEMLKQLYYMVEHDYN